MKKILLISLLLLSVNSLANEAVTTMSDYVVRAVKEVAASPPLKLLENNKGESRREITLGFLTTSTDDNATVSTGATSYESGSASGPGAGFGFSYSWKDRWALYTWLQGATQSGEHTQTINGVRTNYMDAFDSTYVNATFGISHEFFRSNKNHTLNVFAGASVYLLELSGQVQTFNPTGGAQTANYVASLDGIFPAVNFGMMYSFNYFKKVKIIPYFTGMISLADECQTFRVDNIQQTDGRIQDNSPLCGGTNNTGGDGKTDIATDFVTIGIRFEYVPWDMGFNFSGLFRNLFRDGEEQRAPVEGTYFSISTTF